MKIKMLRTRGPNLKDRTYKVTDSFGACQLKAGAAIHVSDNVKVDKIKRKVNKTPFKKLEEKSEDKEK